MTFKGTTPDEYHALTNGNPSDFYKQKEAVIKLLKEDINVGIVIGQAFNHENNPDASVKFLREMQRDLQATYQHEI